VQFDWLSTASQFVYGAFGKLEKVFVMFALQLPALPVPFQLHNGDVKGWLSQTL
jgi:hypothetical protein